MGNYVSTKAEIKDYICARTPLVVVDSPERERVERMLREIATELNVDISYYTDSKQVCSIKGEGTKDVDTVNFKREDEEYEKIKKYFTEKKEAELATIKSWPAYIGFGIGAAALVGCFFAGFWLLVVTLGGAGYGLFKLLSNKSEIKQLEQKCEGSIKATNETMSKLFTEFKQYNKELDEYDAYYEQIKDALAKI